MTYGHEHMSAHTRACMCTQMREQGKLYSEFSYSENEKVIK